MVNHSGEAGRGGLADILYYSSPQVFLAGVPPDGAVSHAVSGGGAESAAYGRSRRTRDRAADGNVGGAGNDLEDWGVVKSV